MKDINLFKAKDSIYLKKVKSKSEIFRDEDCDGYLIESSESEARRIIQSLKGSRRRIGVVGGGNVFNRRAVETLKIDYLVSPERGLKNDGLKQRDSGLNHVVAKIAKEKGILIVIDFSEISRMKGRDKALRLSRIIQNVKICRKAKCGIRIVSFAEDKSGVADEFGRRAFGMSLGLRSSEIVEVINF